MDLKLENFINTQISPRVRFMIHSLFEKGTRRASPGARVHSIPEQYVAGPPDLSRLAFSGGFLVVQMAGQLPNILETLETVGDEPGVNHFVIVRDMNWALLLEHVPQFVAVLKV